ncbi:PhnB protein [Pedobacter sp. CG_S7]|uniref:VOC family protein n=1 Tax=Pedobacter sp. CG_S7 TaxID=3143930 RepID=UPI003394A76A
MAKMSPYLNFDGNAEEAFNFYKSIFGGDFQGSISRMSDAPGMENLLEEEKNRVFYISLPIAEGYTLMGSDICPSMGQKLIEGNNNYISLHPENKDEADHLFNRLSAGGTIEMPMADTFWNAYFGTFKDKFGIYWMINFDYGQQK